MRSFYVIFLTGFILAGCSGPKGSEGQVEIDETKPISELSYGEIWQILLANNESGGMDVETEDYSEEAMKKVIDIMTGNCPSGDCGYKLEVQNTSDRIMTIIVKYSFELPGNEINEIIRSYDVPPMEKVNTGCSSFCYGEETYPVTREVVSAQYK